MALRQLFIASDLSSWAFNELIVMVLVMLLLNALVVWQLHQNTAVVMFCVLAPVFVLVLGLLTVRLPDLFGAIKVIAGLLVGGFMVAMGIEQIDGRPVVTVADAEEKSRKFRLSLIFILVGCLAPYVACGLEKQMIRYVMTGMGVYTEEATIIVNKAAFGKLQATADAKGTWLYSCRLDDDNIAISKVRVWWHGIGDRSYVGLGLADDAIRMELDSAGVRKSGSEEPTSCIDLRRGIYFNSNTADQTPGQWAIAQPIISSFLEKKAKDDSLLIIGYADPTPRERDDNMLLARNRACAIYRKLGKEKLLSNTAVQIDIRGDMYGMEVCDVKNDTNRERACEARNRRVELRLIGAKGAEAGLSATAVAEAVCKDSPAAKQQARAGKPARTN